MPKFRRWFNVSQQINADPEVRRLKKKFGLPGFSMWLEILAKTDQTDGIWKGQEKDIGSVLAGCCQSNTRGAAKVLNCITEIGWIAWQRGSESGNREGLIVVNHAEYHRVKEPQKQGNGADKDAPHPSARTVPSDTTEKKIPLGSDGPRTGSFQSKTAEQIAENLVTKHLPRGQELGAEILSDVTRWVLHQMKYGIRLELIQKALQQVDKYVHEIEKPWGYLEKTLERIVKDDNVNRFESEHAARKKQGFALAGEVLERMGMFSKNGGQPE